MSMKPKNLPPKHGDIVVVSASAPANFRPATLGSVFSVVECSTEEMSAATGAVVGELIVGIEFGDGEAVELPAKFVTVM